MHHFPMDPHLLYLNCYFFSYLSYSSFSLIICYFNYYYHYSTTINTKYYFVIIRYTTAAAFISFFLFFPIMFDVFRNLQLLKIFLLMENSLFGNHRINFQEDFLHLPSSTSNFLLLQYHYLNYYYYFE